MAVNACHSPTEPPYNCEKQAKIAKESTKPSAYQLLRLMVEAGILAATVPGAVGDRQ